MVTMIDIDSLYCRWLQGRSLRTIAASVGISHNTLHTRFQKTYGQQATSLTGASLARSMVADNPDCPETLEYALDLIKSGQFSKVKHRSRHSLLQLGVYQNIRDSRLMDTIAVAPEEDPEISLGFPMFQWVLDALVGILGDSLLWAIGYRNTQVDLGCPPVSLGDLGIIGFS